MATVVLVKEIIIIFGQSGCLSGKRSAGLYGHIFELLQEGSESVMRDVYLKGTT